MSFNEELLSIYQLIKNFKPTLENTLPENAYFLNEKYILCKERKYGDSRYPYTNDGLTLWAHSSGNIQINESAFFYFNPTLEGKQSALSFFGGVKNRDNTFNFVSINGNADNILTKNTPKYVVYSNSAAYYIREFEGVLFALKTGLDKNKNILFSLSAINLGEEEKEIYIASYFNPILTHSSVDSEESKWFKKCELKPYGASFLTIEDLSRSIHLYNYALIKRAHTIAKRISSTTSRQAFASGTHNNITLSEGLKNGYFENEKDITLFNDTAVFADIITSSLKNDERFNLNYTIFPCFNEDDVKRMEEKDYTLVANDIAFNNLSVDTKHDTTNNLKIEFGKFNDLDINNVLFNSFIRSVTKQVDYCARSKNSSISLLGVRDVFQMLEASLLWDKDEARKKIIQSLNYIEKSGRSPRQYSSLKGDENPLMDNREFIDQGQWIITTLHTYLAFTNDYAILDEKCGFVTFIGRNSAEFIKEETTVFDHLLRICSYLLSHVDEDNKCLHTLYGDWNDAVDGLGVSKDKNKKFGNGVSAMATMHLYKNLKEMKEIFVATGKEDPFNIDKWLKDIESGINNHLIVTKGEEKKVIHGFGEDKEFFVGSFNDVDNISRDSLTSNAFYVISGLLDNNPSLKKHILSAYKRLDSKYGYLTFSHYFDRENGSKVGRIVNLPKGTAENAATYIHSAIFAIRSLLLMGEVDEAFKQMYKILPLTHNKLTHSPFVMPNSYIYNPEIGVDGESMNDWYTGSSNTLIKALVFDLFGVRPSVGDTINIKPVIKFPVNEASIELDIKGKHFVIKYINEHNNKREILLNNKTVTTSFLVSDCLDNNLIIIKD